MSWDERAQDRGDELRRENAPLVLPVRGPHTPVPINQPDEPLPPPEYEFLHVTSEFKPVDVASRRLIRSHVMKNYFQEKNKKTNNLSSATSAETVNARDKLKGRWRLGAVEPSDGQQTTTRRKSKASVASSSRRSSQQSAQDETVQVLEEPYDQSSSCQTELTSRDDISTLRRPSIEMFQSHLADPFQAFAIKTGGRTNRIVHFYSHSFTINSLAVNPTGTLYKFVMSDPGLYHAMLSTVSLYMHGHLGIEARQDLLYHRGETMKIIHERLANLENVDKGMLMSTIVTILSFENLCGNYYTAKAHLGALRRLIAQAGGVEQYSENDSLPRAVAWAEYHFSAAHRTVPPYKYNPTMIPPEDFPEELQLETAKTCPDTLIIIPTYGHTIYQIFRRLHLLGIATSSRWKAVRNEGIAMRVNISNMLIDVEYDMLVTSARFAKDRANKENDTDMNVISVCDALVTAAQTFLFASLRSMPIGARTVEIYLCRINAAIQVEDLIQVWNRIASYDALLWTLFVSAVAAMDRPGRDCIVSHLREVAALLNIESQEAFELHLKGVAWADFFESYSAELAKDLFRSRSETSEIGRAEHRGSF